MPDATPHLCTLQGERVVLRPLAPEDAGALAEILADEAVARFVPQPPSSATAWLRFITWSQQQQHSGVMRCWGIVADGRVSPVGVVQLRRLDPEWHAAEWGILLGAAYWGTGICVGAARCVLDFAFTSLHVHRMEARAVRANVRAQRMLEKLGAVPEAILRESFHRSGRSHDQVLWSILAAEWRPHERQDAASPDRWDDGPGEDTSLAR